MQQFAISILALMAVSLAGTPSFSSDNVLQGNWQAQCAPLPDRHSALGSLHLNEGTLTAHFVLFADKSCETQNLTIDMNSQYVVVNSPGIVRNIDLVPTSVQMTLLNPDVVQYYNKNQICNLSGWELNQPKDISGASCPAFHAPKNDQINYDIFQISAGTLRFGAFPNAGATIQEDRPADIQKSPEFKIQTDPRPPYL